MTRLSRIVLAPISVAVVLTIASPTSPLEVSGASGRTKSPVVHVKGNRLVNGAGKAMRLLGVDDNGTQEKCVHNRTLSFGPINQGEAQVISRWGSDAVRVPLNEDCWLGINGLPVDYSKHYYQSAIKKWVEDLNSAGLVAVLDLHFSAPGSFPSTRQWAMADKTHSVKFWTDVAKTFKSDPGVIFDLFNEPALGGTHPNRADWTCWRNGCTARVRVCSQTKGQGTCATRSLRVAGMQSMLNAVRAAGARQPVMIGSLGWAGDPCGATDSRSLGRTCPWLKYLPFDPEHQEIASFHLYNTKDCNDVKCWDVGVAPVTGKYPVVTGELGDKSCSSSFITSYMNWADQHGVSYLVWDWRPPAKARQSCAMQGTHLISNWDGRTNDDSPAPIAVQGHLRTEIRRQGGDF
jgi:endoglucanase